MECRDLLKLLLMLHLLGLTSFDARSVLEQLEVDGILGQMDVTHHGTTDETVLHTGQMGVGLLVQHLDIPKLDVQILINTAQSPLDRQIRFQLHHHPLSNQCLEKRVE